MCKYIGSIDVAKLPTNFKQVRCKEAMSQSLFTYEVMQQNIAKATKEIKGRVTFLEDRLREANARIVHMGKTQEITNRKLKEKGMRTPVQISKVAAICMPQ